MSPPTRPDDAWRRRLDALIGPEEAPGDDAAGRAPGRPMALQFELREVIPPAVRRWGGPIARTITDDSTIVGEVRLAVRPVARSSSGNWSRAEVSWKNLPFKGSGTNLDPAHHSWFSQLAALHRPVRETYVAGDGDWLHLDDYQSPLLWSLLADAAGLGIEFVGGSRGSRNAEIVLAQAASVALDAAAAAGTPDAAGQAGRPDAAPATGSSDATAPAGSTVPREPGGADRSPGLTLRPRILIDGEAVSADSVGTIGDHGLYRFEVGPSPRIVLAPLDEPLTEPRRALLAADPIKVPAASVDEFLRETLPDLHRHVGVTSEDASVDVPAPRPRRAPERAAEETRETPHLTVTTVPSDDPDWFDLGFIVRVGEYNVPFTGLFTALAKGQKRYRLIDGTHLNLGLPVFDRLRELIAEAQVIDEWETTPRLSRYQASLWADFEDLADETDAAVEWRTAARGLLDVDSIPRVEHTLEATLRPYQQAGLDWLSFLYEHRLGGVLADEMGLGKTLQTLALIDRVRRHGDGPFLAVAPTSVVATWASEAAKFAPDLRVRVVTSVGGMARSNLGGADGDTADAEPKPGELPAGETSGVDLVITSYALFRLDFAAYQTVHWAGLVLDEAQFVKNHAALVHQCAKDLRAPFRLAITGTPLENNLFELRALFSIVAPGLFPSLRRFTEEYVRPIERGERERLDRLRRRIRPLVLRRTKQQVAADLPEKQEQVLTVQLQPEHRELYDTVLQRERQKLLGLIDDVDRNRMIIFRSLTLLRMLALDATLIDDAHEGMPSSKLEVLLEHLTEIAAEGHRILVFSQFTSYLRIVAARLTGVGIRHTYLDGATRDRSGVIDEFRGGDAPVFLISLKAGGFGLTLTEADYVFLLDPWWNPAAEHQAIDRTHRIGQTRNVTVYRMIAADTIEEKVLALSQRKAALFTSVLDEGELFSAQLTGDDIRWLVET